MSPPLLKQMGEPHAASSENGPCSGALDGTNEKAKHLFTGVQDSRDGEAGIAGDQIA